MTTSKGIYIFIEKREEWSWRRNDPFLTRILLTRIQFLYQQENLTSSNTEANRKLKILNNVNFPQQNSQLTLLELWADPMGWVDPINHGSSLVDLGLARLIPHMNNTSKITQPIILKSPQPNPKTKIPFKSPPGPNLSLHSSPNLPDKLHSNTKPTSPTPIPPQIQNPQIHKTKTLKSKP